MSRTPTMAEVLREAIAAALEDVHTAIPGRVVNYDAATQTVDVAPLIKQAYVGEDGDRVAASLPTIRGCPVQFPSGGGLTITFPLQAGDTGLIVFSESSLDKWMAGDGGEVDPDFDTRMSLADGVFIPGVRARGAARDVPTGVVAIGRDGGTFQGAGLGKDITDYLGALHTAIVNHAHDWPAGSPPGSALTNPTYTGSIATLGPAPDVESSTVKITP